MIPVSKPDLDGNEARYVADAVESSWISSTGPYIERFERDFADLAGTGRALSVSNGTVALHLALLALGIGNEDEVIVPSLTYVATANAVTYVNATPVFVDVDPLTWCVDPDAFEAALTPRTRAIIVVHLYGHPADMDAIRSIARSKGIKVIEDAAEAHGARYRGRAVGGLGDIATFSFYGNKIMTSGEGGAVTSDDDELLDRARMLRGQGMDPDRRYYFPIVGYNYRLTNVAAAILCAQLERFDTLWARRQQIFDLYQRSLSDLPGLGMQPVAPWAEPAPWLFCVTVDSDQFGCTRDQLMARLAEKGVDTRPFFVPIHSLPPYRDARIPPNGLPVTDALAARGMNLPTYSAMSDEDIERVVAAVRDACMR